MLRGAERRAGKSERLRPLRRGLKFARGALEGGALGSDAWRYELTASEGAAALQAEFRSQATLERSPTEDAWDPELSPVDAMRCADIAVLLRDEMLPKLDRAGMAFGLEGRVPLLDDDFVDAMLAIPAVTHLDHPHGKAVLRSWAAELVPGVDAERAKHGFDVPIQAWLAGPLRDDVDRLLLRPSRPGLVDTFFARGVWAQAEAQIAGAGHAIYAMLVAALWFEKQP
jgi:asparagine synthase (glutamine-hydrolysing)